MATTTYGTPYVQSSDLVSAYPGTSSTLATRVDDISLKGNGLNDQTGTTYTLVLTDGGKTITLNNASAVTVTIPTNTSVAFPLGTEMSFVNKGAGTVTIQPTGGVTLNGGNLTLPQNAAVQIVKLETNTWGQLDSVAVTPGLVLVTPTSIANSGGTASASGGAVTFSGVTSVSLNGVFSNVYQNYRILCFGEGTQNPTQGLCLRLRASGTDAAGTNYVRSWIYNSDSAGPTRAYETNNTRYVIGIVGNWGTSASILSADIFMPNASVYTGFATQFIGYSTTNNISGFGVGSHSVATAYDGFTLLAESSGTISGTVRVYGYKN